MIYIHFTIPEHVKIETYLELGMSIRSIARRLGRQPSTVSREIREIRRNPGYVAGHAQERFMKMKAHCDAKTKLDENADGLLHEFFPKGSDFATVGQG